MFRLSARLQTHRCAHWVSNTTFRDKGFKYYSTGTYTYAAAGNVTNEPSKGAVITYNYLNLPRFFTLGSNTIEIEYDGGGNKLRKTVKQGSTTLYIQNYLGGIEYNSGHLEAVFHAEGRVYNTNVGTGNTTPAFRYEYAIRDHLGNTRILFTDKNNNGVLNVTAGTDNEIIQENHYYPFGMNQEGAWMNDAAARDTKYQYNSKELNDDFGLNWSDYGARWYDGSIGRWNGVDPLAEKMSAWSTYNYAFDNPMRFIDPDGMAPLGDIYNLNGAHIGSDGVEDNKVYVAKTTDDTQLTQEESANVISRANLELYGQSVSSVVQLSVSHSTFLEMAGWAYNENTVNADAQKASLGMLMNWTTAKETDYGFDDINTPQDALNTIYTQTGGKGDPLLQQQRNYLGATSSERNQSAGMKSATASAIHVLTGGKDYSGGAIQEHGRDFFIKDAKGRWHTYEMAQAQGYTWLAGGNFKGDYTPNTKPAHKGNSTGGYKYVITASYGGNIYAKYSDKYMKK